MGAKVVATVIPDDRAEEWAASTIPWCFFPILGGPLLETRHVLATAICCYLLSLSCMLLSVVAMLEV